MDAALRWSPQGNGHVQGPDCQVTLHPVADGPADHPPGMQVEDNRQIQPALLGPDIADVTRPFPVRTGCREVPVQQVRCDVEAVVAVRGRLELPVSPSRNTVITHQAPDAAVADLQAQLFQFLGHAWPAIAAERQGELFTDVSQHNHVLALALAEGAASEGPIPSWADIHDLAQPFDGQYVGVLCDESEPHLLRSAKNWVAFFSTSLSSRSIRFSFRSSATSRSRSDWAAGFSGLRRSRWIQRLSVEKPTPKSAATCLRGRPLVNATRTASARNSGVGFCAMMFLLCGKIPSQRSGTIP